MCEDEMCEVIQGEICEGQNVPLDLRGAKRVRTKCAKLFRAKYVRGEMCH